MKHRTVLAMIMITIVVATATFFAVRKFTSQDVQRTPFTASLVEDRYEGSAEIPHYTEFQIYAEKSDGSQVRLVNRFSNESRTWGVMGELVDVPRSILVGSDPWTQSKTSYPLSAAQLKYYSTPRSNCSKDAQARHDNVLGYDVVRDVFEVSEDPESAFRMETWAAPALDCFALRVVAMRGRLVGKDIVPTARTVREGIWVAKGEPSDSFFVVPANYVERKPSEIDAEFYRKYGRHIASPERMPGLDTRYLSSQQNR